MMYWNLLPHILEPKNGKITDTTLEKSVVLGTISRKFSLSHIAFAFSQSPHFPLHLTKFPKLSQCPNLSQTSLLPSTTWRMTNNHKKDDQQHEGWPTNNNHNNLHESTCSGSHNLPHSTTKTKMEGMSNKLNCMNLVWFNQWNGMVQLMEWNVSMRWTWIQWFAMNGFQWLDKLQVTSQVQEQVH